ncbi:MAG: hypothetical protein NW224_23885 [Leptolyngbyaceae cyanobacterium bins.302]|nr:hypothetical protein [Leptolyngbyaceae cyanobacterium bins.302]
MKNPTIKWFAASAIALTVGVYAPEAKAQAFTQDPNASAEVNPSNTTQPGAYVANPQAVTQQSQDFITSTLNQGTQAVSQVNQFIQNFPSNLGQLFQSTLGAFKAPDLGQLITSILNGSTNQTNSGQLAESLENRIGGKGSFSVRNDLSNEAFRSSSLYTSQQATLSKPAQERMMQIMQETQAATNESASLGEESQNLDVTQQILQNVSQQLALSSQVDKNLMNEAQQARVDRAIGNTLTAEIAEETAGANISHRRETSSAAMNAARQGGLMLMPGGFVLGQDRKQQ